MVNIALERKGYVQIAAVVIVILVLGAALYSYVYLPSLPRELKKLKFVTTVAPKDGFWEYSYANDTGIFREEGLEVEIIVTRTPSEMVQALLSGEVDVIVSIGDSLRAYLGGAEQIRIVMVTMRASFALFVRPEVNSIEEIESIAAPGRGSDGDVLIREYLLAHGLEPDVDVSLQYLAIPTTLPAFLSGQVDAIIAGTNAYPAFKDGKAKILFQFAEEFPKWCMVGLTVTDKMIREQPEVVNAFAKSIYRSQVDLIQNKEKAMQYAVDVLGLEKGYATFVYEYAYEGKYGAATKIIPDMPIEDLEYEIQLDAKYMGVQAKPIQGAIDTTFLEQVKKELG